MLLSFVRTVIVYVVLLLVIRLMGKRQLRQMEPSEFVVTLLVADLASVPMQSNDIPLSAGLIPMVTILGAELLLSLLTLRSIRLRKLLCGKPVILIENGRLLQDNLHSTRISMDELTAQLRLKDVLELRTVQYAILETNGSLSVFLFPKDQPACAEDAGIAVQPQYLPVTLVSDGRILRDNLQKAGKTDAWLQKTLRKQKATLEQTWLLTVDAAEQVVFYRKENPK